MSSNVSICGVCDYNEVDIKHGQVEVGGAHWLCPGLLSLLVAHTGESQCNCQSLVAGIVANVGLLGPFDSFLKVKVP